MPKTNYKRSILNTIGPSIAYVILTKGFYSLIDSDDVSILEEWNWSSFGTRCIYGGRKSGKKNIFIHTQLLRPYGQYFVDHINRNTLDNRRINLRLATNRENLHNSAGNKKRVGRSSKYKGVSAHGKKCVADIRVGDSRFWSSHSTEREAALAYDAHARRMHGKFGFLNGNNYPELENDAEAVRAAEREKKDARVQHASRMLAGASRTLLRGPL